MSKIELKNLTFTYEKTRRKDSCNVFENLSITFENNSFNVIIGPSGCGKTTLLRLITGFLEEYEGNIFIDGINTDNLSVKERNIAYINQNYALYPHLSVFDNIAFPLRTIGASKDEIIARVTQVAEELDLSITLSRKPKYLSGGQKQRVAIARGIVKNAKIYLFDEPLSNVDQLKRAELRLLIKSIIKKYHATAIYVTHDFNEAMALADNLFVMDNGKIVIYGTPKEVYESGNEVVNDYIKASSTNLIYEKKDR